jgi:hypothetical protein
MMASWVGKAVKRSNPCRHVEVVTRDRCDVLNRTPSLPHCGTTRVDKIPAFACQQYSFAIRFLGYRSIGRAAGNVLAALPFMLRRLVTTARRSLDVDTL